MKVAMTTDDQNQRSGQDGRVRHNSPSKVTISPSTKAHPVDRGWAWAIVAGAFGIHFFSFGYIRSFGILFLEFQRKFDATSAETAVVSGVQFCVYSLTTLLATHVILKRFSVRQCCMLGSVLQSLGIALNGIVPGVKYLIITQGILFGIGYALLYCPAVIILSQYFHEKRAIATVVASCGVSAGGVTLPLLIRYLIDAYGLSGGLLLLAATMLHQLVFSALFTPTSKYQFVSEEELSVDDDHEHCGAGSRLTPQGSSQERHDFEPAEDNDVHNKENQIKKAGDVPSQYNIPSTQEDESSSLLEQHLFNGHRPHPLYPSNQLTALSCKENRPQETDNAREANDETDPPIISPFSFQHSSGQQNELLNISEQSLRSGQDLQQKCVLGKGGDIDLLTERSFTYESSALPQETSRKPSLKAALLNGLSTSVMDLHGSLNSFAHLDPAVLSGSAADKSNDHDVEQDDSKKRCRVPTVIKTVAFWAVLVFFGCGGIASGLPPVFMPPLVTEKELSGMSTIMLIVSALTEMAGRLIPGFILHAGYMKAPSVVILPMIAGATLYQFTALYNDFGTLLTMAILSGLFTGAFWATQSLVVIDVFGLNRLGTMLGFYFLILGLSLGASHPIAGLLRDISGTYVATFHFFGVMYYMAALMMVVILFIKRGSNKS